MKNSAKKHPIAYGLTLGYGGSLLFILLEFLLVKTGISECGVWVDSGIRMAFGVAALVFLKIFYGERFKNLFTRPILSKTWLYCIPFAVYCLVELLYFAIAKGYSTQYMGLFLAVCVQQIATGFWEESASRGLVMSGMLERWTGSVKGRIGMTALSGVLFGSLHIWGFLFGGDVISSLWNALYATAWGMFMAAIYLRSRNLLLCMTMHAVWDIAIRVWDYFCVGLQQGVMLAGIRAAEDILQLAVMPVIAIVICVLYKPQPPVDRRQERAGSSPD